MRSYNNTTIIGNVGQDPEQKKTSNGTDLLTFSVAVTETLGKDRDHTSWFRCVVWGKLAGAISGKISKGDAVFVTGAHRGRTWEDDDGNKNKIWELVVDQLRFLGSPQRKDSQQGEPEAKKNEAPKDDDLPF